MLPQAPDLLSCLLVSSLVLAISILFTMLPRVGLGPNQNCPPNLFVPDYLERTVAYWSGDPK
jgi:hypothetical protein